MTDESQKHQPTQESPDTPRGAGDWRPYIWIILAVMLGFYWADYAREANIEQLTYTEFKSAVKDGRVESVVLRGQEIRGEFTGDAPQSGAKDGKKQFKTVRPPFDDPELMSLLEQHDVAVRAESTRSEWWQQLLIAMLPWIIILGIIIYVSQKMQQRMASGGQGGLFGFGSSRARRFREEDTRVRMEDVAGSDNAKRDLQEIIDYLRDPGRYLQLGAEIPRGVLLMGPPGTGKTLLAKAVAGEAEVPFYSISGSEFIEMFVGVGAARVRDMFRDARKNSPAIVFIDELDSIGRSRGTGLGGGHDEREQTLNQILSEMDGFEAEETVVVLAATNRPDVLDPALLRPGRFDRKIVIDRPHREARRAILDVHCRNKPLAGDVDLDKVAERTVGFAGADLYNLVNEAALLAGRRGQRKIDMACFDAARDKIVLGDRREERITEEDRRVIAYHESGHTLMAWLLPHADPPDKVTIIPRGRALGATEQHLGEERYNMTESYLRDRVGVMLGGRTAEKLMFGEVSTGAQEDLRQATDLVRKMVAEWGMSARLGAAAFPRGEAQPFLGREMTQPPNFSEQTAELMDQEIRSILSEIDEQTDRLMQDNRYRLEALAERLLRDETLHAAELEAILKEAA